MLNIVEEPQKLVIRMSSDLSLLPQATRQCVAFLRGLGLGACPDVALVSRELLCNAIRHGNQNRQDKSVLLKVRRLNQRQVELEVEDEGTGFDHTHLNLDLPEDPRWLHHRGLAVVNTLAKGLRFNDTGNRVTVWLDV